MSSCANKENPFAIKRALSVSDEEGSCNSSPKITPSVSSCSLELNAEDESQVPSVPLTLDEPAKLFEKKHDGVCTLFKVYIKGGSRAFRYDVDVLQITKDREKNLTKGADDGQKALNKTICFELMYRAFSKTQNFEDSELAYVYDSRSTLFTNLPIRKSNISIEIKVSETSRFIQKRVRAIGFKVIITPSSTSHVIDLTDLSQYTQKRAVEKEDRSVRTFLEMLFSHDALLRNTYTIVGAGSLFENAETAITPIGNGMVLRTGLSKGVRVIENDGDPMPALVVDFKKCPFYASQWFIDSVAEFCNKKPPETTQDRTWSIIAKYYRGVRLYPTYQPSANFVFGRFSKEAIQDIKVDLDGQKVSLPEFYERKHELKLSYHHFPAVVAEQTGKGPKRYFPIELLKVLANQRVPMERFNERLSKAILKENVVPPEVRYENILTSLENLNLVGEENESLEKFGVRLDPTANQVHVGVRRKPTILIDGIKLKPNEKTQFKGNVHGTDGIKVEHLKYAVTEPLKRWAILYPEAMDSEEFSRFAETIIKFAEQKGIKVEEPKLMKFEDSLKVWAEAFELFEKNRVQLVMLIDEKENKTHGKLKLFECLHKILTQHLTYETMKECISSEGRPLTLENIVNKLNCKHFGLNYTPIVEPIAQKYALERGEVLVIGYDVAHPPPLTGRERRLISMNSKFSDLTSLEPSVVGISANVASDPHMFVGDFFYQETRKESVDVIELSRRMTWLLRILKKNRHQHAMPPYIFVVRDGLSEGQFAMAKDEELLALKEGCQEYDPNYNPKFIFIIATKRHNKRFFTIGPNGRAENLEPGSVIYSGPVRQDVTEFFMQSHFPFQGTAKSTQYGILVDEFKISQDEVQAVLNALCYEHQIINSAISIPEPVYQADELAKRGQDIYRELRSLIPDRIPRRDDGSIDFNELTAYLSYKDSCLESTRFSA